MSLAAFSNEDFIVWIKANVAGKGKIKEDLIKAMSDSCMTGADLVQCTGFQDFADFDGVKAVMARKVFNGLAQQFPKQMHASGSSSGSAAGAGAASAADSLKARAAKADKTDAGLDALLSRNEAKNKKREKAIKYTYDDRFKVSVFISSKRILTKNTFHLRSTVLDLKKEIVANETGGNATDLKLYCAGNPMADAATLQEAGIVSSECWVHQGVRVIGGAALPKSESDEKKADNGGAESNKKLLDNGTDSRVRERVPHFQTNKNISPSLEVDCVTFDDSNELRVKMPCGHVFASLTIFSWSQRTLECYSKSQVCCPIGECGKEWKIADIVSAADLDESEHESLANILTRRQLMADGYCKECPSCHGLVELPDEVYLCRVRCRAKQCAGKKDFCWLCNKEWKGNGLSVCGNNGCVTAKVNDILKIENCGTTNEVMNRTDVAVPKIRACPRCLSITEYKVRCKHMVCWNCKRSFCFICLALAGKEVNGHGEQWACEGGDSHAGKCKVAPVQVLT